MYVHRYETEKEYLVIERWPGGEREISLDQHDYLAWIAAGNVPEVEAVGRFLSVVDGVLVVDPNKDAILADEAEAKAAELAKEAAREADISTGLPSWEEVEAAITAATTGAIRIIILRLARVVYWLAKNSPT